MTSVATKSKKARAKARKFIDEFLKDKFCIDCGLTNPYCLEFDHVVFGKKYAISYMISSGYSIKSIAEELKKCDIRCANCHRLVTRTRRLEKLNANLHQST